ncbi:MAG: radical SAM family heme chaperone HemW [Candidatus Zapsychrus exili]|nr:radical SAM family heme chaperone HemW [Candidatus Zapsychrus exili]
MTLYIHIPFCLKKCSYCSFVVFVRQEKYIDSYLDCISLEAKKHKYSKVDSIYLGGGTPACLNNEQLIKLFSIIRDNFSFSENVEFTIETNPESLDKTKIQILKNSGVNRVSLGIQSLNNKYLKYLGRSHSRLQAIKSFNLIRQVGINNISVDVMYSFYGQTDKELKKDVDDIAMLGSGHISLYSLSIEKNSRFFVLEEKLKDQDAQVRQYLLVKDKLESLGYRHYEVSNFAKKGCESKHNINYWQGGEYIGLGVGAHSHIKGLRFWNVSRLRNYIELINKDGDAKENVEKLNKYERFKETLLFSLRMIDGVDIKLLNKRFNVNLKDRDINQIKMLEKEGLLEFNGNKLKTTRKGLLVLDEICSQLI